MPHLYIFALLIEFIAHTTPACTEREQTLLRVIAYLQEELLATRKQLAHKPRLSWPERLRLSKLARLIPKQDFLALVPHLWKPETVLGWVQAWQRKQANKPKRQRKSGRQPIDPKTVEQVLLFYQQGIISLRKIVGECKKCDIAVSHTTVAKILRSHGLVPGGDGESWAAFLKRHAHALIGTDFLTVPVGLMGKIVNVDILFGIEHDTRKVHLLGITQHANTEFMLQVARNMTDPFDGYCIDKRNMLIHDNDTKFSQAFCQSLEDKDVTLKRTSYLAPNMNAIAERWVKSIKHECMNKYVFLSQDMLERVVREYITYYNNERPHQAKSNEPLADWEYHGNTGAIVIDERCGGLLKSARRLAV